MNYKQKQENRKSNNDAFDISYRYNTFARVKKNQAEYAELVKQIKWLVRNQRYCSVKTKQLVSATHELLENDFRILPQKDRLLLFRSVCELPNMAIYPSTEDCIQEFEKLKKLGGINFGHMSALEDGRHAVSKLFLTFTSQTASSEDSQMDRFLSMFVALLLSRMAELRGDVAEGFGGMEREQQMQREAVDEDLSQRSRGGVVKSSHSAGDVKKEGEQTTDRNINTASKQLQANKHEKNETKGGTGQADKEKNNDIKKETEYITTFRIYYFRDFGRVKGKRPEDI